MFRVTDLIFIVPAIVAIVGAVVVSSIGSGVVPITISWATAAVFVYAVFYFYRMKYDAYRHDYKTRHDLRVRLGKKNKPSRILVEAWVESVFAKYLSQQVIDCSGNDLKQAVYDKLAVFLDKEKLSVADRYVRGYATAKQIVVGFKAEDSYVEDLFCHELEHHILNQIGVLWDEEVHHKLMKQINDY